MRIVASVEYEGTHYHGFQNQGEGASKNIQAELEKALSFVANEKITLIAAGRTDAKVHASNQIIHFDTTTLREKRSWLLGTNTALPKDISLRWIKLDIRQDFHARFSAISRRYHYYIFNHPLRSALCRDRAAWICTPLSAEKMNEAAQDLIGEHDFSAFRASSCQSKSPMRYIHFIEVRRIGENFICIDIQANAFLHHMVRNIAGTLISIGEGKKPIAFAKEILNSKNRKKASPTAPPEGLYLKDVNYPSHFDLPRFSKNTDENNFFLPL